MRTQEDLDRMFDALDIVYFLGACREHGIKVSWRKFRKTKNSFFYGRFFIEEKRICINRVLARPEVPDYVVLATLLHEQLHHIVGPDHDTAFQMAEMRFVHHTAAELWESENHQWLLSA